MASRVAMLRSMQIPIITMPGNGFRPAIGSPSSTAAQKRWRRCRPADPGSFQTIPPRWRE